MATAGHGRLRASDADREQAIEVLKAAFVQGLLVKSEFDMRVGKAFTSRTYAELDWLTAGIPAGPAGSGPVRKAARSRARVPVNQAVKSGASAIIAAGRRAGSLHVAPDRASHVETGPPDRQKEAHDRIAGVWGPAVYAWTGEERPRAAGFPIDLSGRRRVLGFPAR